jgi:hypothetical protein
VHLVMFQFYTSTCKVVVSDLGVAVQYRG